MTCTLWIVRHGERVDNINSEWQKDAPRGAWDDSPLTIRGKKQAKEVGYCLSKECEKIDYVFSSPFTRCLQTTTDILLAFKKFSNNNIQIINETENKNPKIFVEPGFCESLNVCKSPPGYLELADVKYQFSLIDTNYKPYLITQNLPLEMTSLCCFKRVQETLTHIIQNYKGNILIVSHGSPITACHAALTSKFKYVGQCTISKYSIKSTTKKNTILLTEIDHMNIVDKVVQIKNQNNNNEITSKDMSTIDNDNSNKNKDNDKLLEKNYPFNKNGELRQDLLYFKDIINKFNIKCVRVGDSSHLSDPKNLRDMLSDAFWKAKTGSFNNNIYRVKI